MPHKKRKTTTSRGCSSGVPPKALPVTLLSGFLGSGKTTLLQHILRTEHGLRIAVIVNDIGAINVDASLIKKTHHLSKTNEKVVALQNGCICCTLRGDLLEELVRLAQLQEFDYIIIESSGISEPEQVAETFDSRLAEQMDNMSGANGNALDDDMIAVLEKLKKAGGLAKFARLDTAVTVIDAFTMLQDFDTEDLISARRDDVTPEDERTVSDLMVDQIEFANVIILNKTEMIDAKLRARAIGLIRKLNHNAEIIETSYGKVDVKKLVNTGLFNLEEAQTGYGWLQDLHAMTVREVNGRNVITPKPETEEYGVRSHIYSRHRPFHPQRLFELLHDKFILQLEHFEDEDEDDDEDEDEEKEADAHDDEAEDEDIVIVNHDNGSDSGSSNDQNNSIAASLNNRSSSDTKASSIQSADDTTNDEKMADAEAEVPSNEVILQNKRQHGIFGRLFRSKGEFYLATRPHRAGDWSQAGAMLTMTGGRPWFCTLHEEDYLTGDAEVDSLVKHDIAKGGEWGDRRQELVFIGEKLDSEGLEVLLDECLLNDAEFEKWQQVMRNNTFGDHEKKECLEQLFDDGFPDWQGDDEEEDEHDHDHQHSHGHGIRSIRKHLSELEEVS